MNTSNQGRYQRIGLILGCFVVALGLLELLSLPSAAAATPTSTPYAGDWSGTIIFDSGGNFSFTVNPSGTQITELTASLWAECGTSTINYGLLITPGMPSIPLVNNTFTYTLPGGLFVNDFVLPFKATGSYNLEFQSGDNTCLGGGYWTAYPVNDHPTETYLPQLQN